MIQAKELRIGNYLYYRDKESFLEVVSLGSRFETINERGLLYGSDDIEEYKPIPLTEEILLKCGFEYSSKDWLELKYKNLIFNTDRSVNMSVVYLNTCNDWLEIKHLHQLQNLYFALTGKELEIKL